MPGIAKEDIKDLDIVDSRELLSDGTDAYQSGVGVVSVTASTKTVVVSGGIVYNDDPVEPGDLVTIAGNAAAGDYTVDTVTDDTTFTVVEATTDATSGTVTFYHPPGATKVGIDPTNLNLTDDNVQDALESIVGTGSSGGGAHRTLRHLIHFISEGPAEGFASGAYKEKLPSGSVFPTSVIWWESSSKLKKIVEKTITRSGGGATKVFPTPVVWKIYDTDGSTVLATITDDITYSGVLDSTVTRTVS